MSRKRTQTRGLAKVLAAALLVLSCDSGGFVSPDGPTPPTPTSIQIDSIAAQIARDDTIALHAAVLDENGSPISGVSVDWSSSDKQVATITSTSGSGTFLVAQDQGTASITASYDKLTASKTIRVHRRPTDLVYVSGSGQTADAGQPLANPLVVRAVDRRGDPVSGVDVSFVVVAGGGSVSPSGGLTDGDGRISADWTLGSAIQQQVEARASEAQQRVQQLKDSVVVFTASTGALARIAINIDSATMGAIGDTVTPTATGYDANGSPMPVSNVTWSSSDTTVAAVDKNGTIRGRGNGVANVQATAEGMADTLSVRVRQVPIAVSVVPTADTLNTVGDTSYLHATAVDSLGNVVPDAVFDWTTTDSSVVEVNSMGRLTAIAAGTALAIASTAGCADSAGVIVQTTAISADTTPPAAPSGLAVASTWTDSTRFAVTASWQPVPDAALYGWKTGTNSGGWSDQDTTSNASVTTSVPVSSDDGSGYWLCVASVDTAGNTSTDAACTSYASPPAPGGSGTIVLSAAHDTLYGTGDTLTVTAVARDSNGAVVSDPGFNWTSQNPTVITVDSMGRLTAQALGTAMISVSAVCCGSDSAEFSAVDTTSTQANVIFHSDWATALGRTDAAILDAAKPKPWNDLLNRGDALEVVRSTGLDFPTANVLRVDAVYRSGGGAYAANPRYSGLPVPGVGGSLYYRWYYQCTVPNSYDSDPNSHPIQDYLSGATGQTNWAFRVTTHTNGTWSPDISVAWSTIAWPDNHWGPATSLNKNQTYRFEVQIKRTSVSTFEIHARIYDTAGNLLYGDADFENADGSKTLNNAGGGPGDYPQIPFANVNNLTDFQVGFNDYSTGTQSDFGWPISYQGGVAICTGDWCGPYNGGY